MNSIRLRNVLSHSSTAYLFSRKVEIGLMRKSFLSVRKLSVQPVKINGNHLHETSMNENKTSIRTQQKRTQMLGLAMDVEHVKTVMDEIETLEHLLKNDQEEHDDQVTNRSVELRGLIKHIVTNKEFGKCLDRLEHEGKPLWGLSSDEHDLISLAREKINQS